MRAEISKALRTAYSERGVRLWWRTGKIRLAGLTPDELLELGCIETLWLEVFRVTGHRGPVAESGERSRLTSDNPFEQLRAVTDAYMQVRGK